MDQDALNLIDELDKEIWDLLITRVHYLKGDVLMTAAAIFTEYYYDQFESYYLNNY
jgi:hypothetical protein